jgi:hypothetical protein
MANNGKRKNNNRIRMVNHTSSHCGNANDHIIFPYDSRQFFLITNAPLIISGQQPRIFFHTDKIRQQKTKRLLKTTARKNESLSYLLPSVYPVFLLLLYHYFYGKLILLFHMVHRFAFSFLHIRFGISDSNQSTYGCTKFVVHPC